MPRKQRTDDDGEVMEDDDEQVTGGSKSKEDDDDQDVDTLGLDEAEEEEEDEDEDEEDDEEEFVKDTVATLETRRVFQHEAEEILDNLTLEDVQEVLKDNEIEISHAGRLKRILTKVIEEGEMDNWEEAWEEAIDRLEEELD
jgi:hypothetical protein